MNVQNVKSQATGTNMVSSKADKDNLLSLGKVGDEIEGVITSVSDQISINFNGKEVNLPKSSVQGATEGTIKKYKIMDISATSVILKEVGINKEAAKSIQAYCTKVESDQASFNKRLEEAAENKGEEADEDLEDTANRMTADDSEDLEAEGYDYKQYELERLERALTRVKEQRTEKEQSVKKQIESNKEFKEDVKKIAKHILEKSPYAEQIIERLENSNLPITEANISKIVNGMNLAETIPNLSKESFEYLIGNELDITIGNIYKASYSAFGTNTSPLSSEDFDEIQGQVDSVIEDAGYEVTEESRSQAKWILDNRLPLTKETLNKLNSLVNLRDNYDSSAVLDKMIRTMEQAVAVEDTVLTDKSTDEIEKLIKDIKSITDEAIAQTAQKYDGKEITIDILKKEQEQMNQMLAATESNKTTEPVVIEMNEAAVNDIDIKAITAKRQLEEIRLKMTLESGQKMAEKGINVNTTGLERVVEELRNIEDDYYRNLLKETGTEQTSENVAILRETTQKVNDLKWMPSNVLADTFTSREDATIDSLHEAGTMSHAKFNAANESYETLMTAPRQDMGDSIQKAFKNSMTEILDSLELEDTVANQRAIRMLGYNGMEITEENIALMKEYDEKVNYVLKNLTPSVTMDFIRGNKNPIDMPLDTLNEEIKQFRDENGISEEDGYARYLRKLEKQDGITSDERDAYIGIYRLLHNVEKTDGAAIGSLARSGRDITLENLLTEVRTRRTGSMDKSVDDSFGMLTDITYKSDSITSQISKGFEAEQSKGSDTDSITNYNQMLLDDILASITPSQVKSIMENEDWSSLSLEKLRDMLNEQPEDQKIKQEYYEEQVKELRDLAENSEEGIKFLSNQNVPVSIQTIQEAQVLLDTENNLYKQVLNKAKDTEDAKNDSEEALNAIAETFEDKESLQKGVADFAKVADTILGNQISNPDINAEQVSSLQLLRGAIKLSNALSSKEYYDIPIKVGDSITNISLTVLNNTGKQDSKVSMSVQSERYGLIEAEFKVHDRQAKGLILCDNQEANEIVKGNIDIITDSLEKQNISLSQMDIGVEKLHNQSYKARGSASNQESKEANGENAVTTKELYQVAKSFVVLVKRMEQNN
ncbi:DUF6240 domain-containing protein [Anaerosporobacter sp.]|uniref:DUF6240 domain-containing protein n=1 Tax=Anaerosporobacter sp. TaxID=1872529 RepID=UPI00286F34AA|nr:DUF6240 domain-containing protein [Anaerosporobacter sp.]